VEEISLNQLIHTLPEYFQPERAAGLDVTVQVNLAGEKGGEWTVTIQNQICTVVDGGAETPTLTVEAAAQDILDMINGSLDPMAAFMMGRLRLKGDRAKAMKLISLFKITSLPF